MRFLAYDSGYGANNRHVQGTRAASTTSTKYSPLTVTRMRLVAGKQPHAMRAWR